MGENWLRQSLQNNFFPQYGVLTSVRAKRKPCNDFRKRRAISWDLPPSGHVIEFTWYLQDLDSPSFSIYMIFTGSWQPPFFDLHDIYRISRAPIFQFKWYLQDIDSPPFSIYMIFTGYRQPPFFNLHGIYRIWAASLYYFTRYLQDLASPPFSIYLIFTGSREPHFFNFRGIYNVIYRILAATLFQFTWYLQDLGRLPLINLHVIYMICVLLLYNIYSIFLYIYMFFLLITCKHKKETTHTLQTLKHVTKQYSRVKSE